MTLVQEATTNTDAGPALPYVRQELALARARPRRPWGYTLAYWLGGALLAAGVLAVAITIISGSTQAFSHYGLGFLTSTTWSPGSGQYAPGVLVVDTVVVTGVAMALAVPVGIGAAIALTEVVPARLGGFMASVIDLLAGVPTIVIGLWALAVLLPLFERDIEPSLKKVPWLGHNLFGGFAYGTGILLAATVLAITVLPTLVSLSRSALLGVPRADREAARALGATQWQAVHKVLLPSARPGIGAAITLATGRALGESISVALVIGSTPVLPHSLLSQAVTLGSGIVNNFGEASPGLGRSAVIALGAVLFVLTMVVNAIGRATWGRGRQGRRRERVPVVLTQGPAGGLPPLLGPTDGRAQADLPPAPFPPAPSLPEGPTPREGIIGLADRRPSLQLGRSLRWRLWRGRAAEGFSTLFVLVALVPLVALFGYTIYKGADVLSWSFFVRPQKLVLSAQGPVLGGGISTAIAGTLKIMGLALAIAVPISMLGALFLYEANGRLAALLRSGTEVLAGVPAIVIGIFAYSAIVVPLHHPSLLAAAVAVAVLMLPIMTRANEEAIRSVPRDLSEAGAALGAGRSRVMRSVVLRSSLPGLVAGNLLATARACGETAPLLFTLAAPTMAMTLTIYNDATQGVGSMPATAWGTAFVLLAGILVLSLSARGVAAHLTRKAR